MSCMARVRGNRRHSRSSHLGAKRGCACAGLVLAGLSACASGSGRMVETALPAPRGRPALIEYPRVPEIVAEACQQSIDHSGWAVATVGRAFDYRGVAYVDYRVVRADGGLAGARCVYDGQTGRATIHSITPPVGPVVHYPRIPEPAGEACRAEVGRLGWRVVSTGRAVSYGGDVVGDYQLASSTADRSGARCFYDARTQTARIRF